MTNWQVIEEIPVSSIFPWPYAWLGWVRRIKQYLGTSFTEGRTASVNGAIWHIANTNEALALAELGIKKIQDQKFVNMVEKETYKVMHEAKEFWINEIANAELSKKTNAELLEIYNKSNEHIEALYGVGLIPSTLDMSHNAFSEKLSRYVAQRGKSLGLTAQESGEAFSALTTVEKKTLQQLQEEDFFKLLIAIEKNSEWKKSLVSGKWSDVKPLKNMIEAHAEKYGWLSRGYEGPILWTPEYFADLLSSEAKQGVNAEKKLVEMGDAKKKSLAKQREYSDKLEIDAAHAQLFDVARRFTVVKNDRKDIVLEFYWRLDKLMREIGKRLQVSEKQAKYILPNEMKDALLRGEVDANELRNRQKLSYFTVTSNDFKIFTGKEAQTFISSLQVTNVETHELRGHCACPGKAIGVVKIINSPSEMTKMKSGDVLVSHATEPNLVPAMKLAAAIVTDQGGITSHAAIVSRELGIPCLIGTKIATKVFKDGDKVEVDAASGVIRKL